MNGTRILGVVAGAILASSLGFGAVACGAPTESQEAITARTVQAASVTIELYDANNVRVGQGSGVLLSPNLVLTSAHLIAGKHHWVVKNNAQVANATRGLTYDWMKYDSANAHPRKHDVGVLHLNESIKLDAYPVLVNASQADGADAHRMRSNGAGFEAFDAKLTRYKGAPNAWLTAPGAESLDTGGAVYNADGIVGVVSGKGSTTGQLYIAKTNSITKWLSPKVSCSGGMAVRTYAEGAKKETICEDKGTVGTTGLPGANGSPTGSNANGAGASNSNNPGITTNPGSESPGLTCTSNWEGVCSGGMCLEYPKFNLGGGPAYANQPGYDANGNPLNQGGAGSVTGNGTSNTNNPSGTPTTGGGPNAGQPGYDANGNPINQGGTGSTVGTGTSSTNNGQSPNGGGAAGSAGAILGFDGTGTSFPGGIVGSWITHSGVDANGGFEDSTCQGPQDNPEICPPEGDGCVGSACGGGAPDNSIEYGDCACGAAAAPAGDGPIVK